MADKDFAAADEDFDMMAFLALATQVDLDDGFNRGFGDGLASFFLGSVADCIDCFE